MRRWNAILRVFVAEYLNLRPKPSKHKYERTHEDLVSIVLDLTR
jgi:hypothetical protein